MAVDGKKAYSFYLQECVLCIYMYLAIRVAPIRQEEDKETDRLPTKQ